MNSTIALLTDFGIDDPYVGIMKGIISHLSPGTSMIDITHQIPAGDIQRGAFVLWQAAQDFPKGTIFLCVVDPGVGTERKGVFLQTRDHTFVGPDNGLFSYLLYKSDFSCWELRNPDLQGQNRSSTFHGRDIFAPAAANAAKYVSGDQFGPQVDQLKELPRPDQKVSENSLEGQILSRDHFGNLFTSLGKFKHRDNPLHYESWIDGTELQIHNKTPIQIHVNDLQLQLVRTFGSVDQGHSPVLSAAPAYWKSLPIVLPPILLRE